MKCVIAGSRVITDFYHYEVVKVIYRSGWVPEITEVVHGDADGVDTIAKNWANGMGFIVTPFPVTKEEWRRLGKKAGPLRNRKMAQYADRLILAWDGKSDGSRSMLEIAEEYNLPVYKEVLRL